MEQASPEGDNMSGMNAIYDAIQQGGRNMLGAYQIKEDQRRSALTQQLMEKRNQQLAQQAEMQAQQNRVAQMKEVMGANTPQEYDIYSQIYGLQGLPHIGPQEEFTGPTGERFVGPRSAAMKYSQLASSGDQEAAMQAFLQGGGMRLPGNAEKLPTTYEAAAIRAYSPAQLADPEFLRQLNLERAATGAARNVNNVYTGRESELGKQFLTEIPKMRESASASVSALEKIEEAKDIVQKQGNKVLGLSGAWRRQIAPYAAAAGLDTESMTASQILESLLNSNAGSLRLQIVGPGPVSNYEQQILQQVSGKKMSTEEGIYKILDSHSKTHERNINNYNQSIFNLSGMPGYEMTPNLFNPIVKPKRKAKGETGELEATEKPPIEGAKQGKDGKWYIEKDGRFFEVSE